MQTKKQNGLLSKIYVFELIKNLFKAKNWFAVTYLLMNIAFVGLIPYVLVGGREGGYYEFTDSLRFIGFYLIVAVITLSPIGEFILRLVQGCRKITDIATLNRLEPLFMEVKETAKIKHPELVLHDDINLYIVDDEDINAFALGRKTVCVTTGLLRCSDEHIKGVLAHEFGHLAMHDTDLILLITVGNFIITAIVTIIKIILLIFELVALLFDFVISIMAGGSEAKIATGITKFIGLLTLLFVDLIMFIWTKIGVLMVMTTSRSAEFDADAFACDLGYSSGLVSFLQTLLPSGENAGNNKGKNSLELFAVLASSHPKTQLRIDRIMNFANQSVE